jgi:hypothetical protein
MVKSLTSIMFLYSCIIAFGDQSFAPFGRDNGIIQTNDVKSRGIHRVDIVVCLVCALESSYADAIYRRFSKMGRHHRQVIKLA